MSTFFSGSVDPFWPHVLLLTAAIIASFAVAIGIVLESPHWSIANALVIGGVALEAVCTLLLFGFDEGISNAQQSKIIALERQIAPRSLSKDEQTAIAAVLRPLGPIQFDMCIAPGIEDEFLHNMEDMLALAGWSIRNFGNSSATSEQLIVPNGYDPGIGVCGSRQVQILVDPSHETEFRKPAATLRGALIGVGIPATASVMDVTPRMRAEIMHIQIGSRL
jgi:hypothetical protein